MIAIVLTPPQAAGLLQAVAASYAARQLAPYWFPLPVEILTGPHAGGLAVDVGPDALHMAMRDGLTLEELPDFATIMEALGQPPSVEVADEDLKRNTVIL